MKLTIDSVARAFDDWDISLEEVDVIIDGAYEASGRQICLGHDLNNPRLVRRGQFLGRFCTALGERIESLLEDDER